MSITPARRCYIHLRAGVYNTCAQVYMTPARRCYRHLRAGVTVTNLYTLVKHAPRTSLVATIHPGAQLCVTLHCCGGGLVLSNHPPAQCSPAFSKLLLFNTTLHFTSLKLIVHQNPQFLVQCKKAQSDKHPLSL